MNNHAGPYHVVDLPPERRNMPYLLDLMAEKHRMYGLMEVDVTHAKQFIEDAKAETGELLSFTGYVAFCLARAVAEDKAVQAYMKGHKQLIVYDNVNVGLMVEHTIGEKHLLVGHVIWGANHKTYREIHQGIRAAQSDPTFPKGGPPAWLVTALRLPWPLSRLCRALLLMVVRRDPTLLPSAAGTVGITAVGMFGEGQGGWGIAPVSHSLDLIVGSTAWKPAIVEGRIEAREILNLTLVFDHDVIDGAPAARFARRLVEMMESGYGLDVEKPMTPVRGKALRSPAVQERTYHEIEA